MSDAPNADNAADGGLPSHDLFGILSKSAPPLNTLLLVHWNGEWFTGRCTACHGGIVFYTDASGWNGIATVSGFKWVILPNKLL